VTVNSIAPGAMKTTMLAEVLKGGSEFRRTRIRRRDKGFRRRRSLDGPGCGPSFVSELTRARGITGKLVSAVWDDRE
jgi:NAD(P)-dependent dehydrogenase (short-subunit alcohol dehydrogenase family)